MREARLQLKKPSIMHGNVSTAQSFSRGPAGKLFRLRGCIRFQVPTTHNNLLDCSALVVRMKFGNFGCENRAWY